MKIFVSYKFKGSDIEQLKRVLGRISEEIEKLGHTPFIFYRDVQRWGHKIKDKKQIIEKALKEVDNCDCLLVIIDNKDYSEGMLLEAGYAKAKGKKIYLLIKDNIDEDHYRFLRNIAEKKVIFTSVAELRKPLSSLLPQKTEYFEENY